MDRASCPFAIVAAADRPRRGGLLGSTQTQTLLTIVWPDRISLRQSAGKRSARLPHTISERYTFAPWEYASAMNIATACAQPNRLPQRVGKLLVVLAGILIGQFILYGPSLLGRKILLPLDILAAPNAYLPRTPDIATIVPHNTALSDLVFSFEPARQFAVSEIRAGRFPSWTPCQYAGAPFVEPTYSPLQLVAFLTPSPVILAWTQLLIALIAGGGMYLFCRRALRVSFWAATIPAWCYPMTGLFVFWQGYPTSATACWLPWLLLTTDMTARRTNRLAPIWLALTTCLVLLSGHIDIAGQVLLISAIYAAWCWLTAHSRQWSQPLAKKAALALVAGWALGFLLASVHLLPLLEYARTGSRVMLRGWGTEARPPVGWAALPQTVLPDMYGSSQAGSLRIVNGNQIESSAAAYAGVIAALFLAPLAWCSRRHRAANALWCALGFLGLSWCLNVPIIVDLLRLPGLNLMSHNRLVFATSFSIIAMTAIGLDVLIHQIPQRKWWFGLPVALLVALCGWCLYRAFVPPEPIATELESAVRQHRQMAWVSNMDDVRSVQNWFLRSYLASAACCAIALAAWAFVWFQRQPRRWLVPLLAAAVLADLLWFAYGRSAQCDPSLYYPRVPLLEQLAKASPGRIVGFDCLPAQLPQTHGLRSIQGYDGVDPARLIELVTSAADPGSRHLLYALTQWFHPRVNITPPDTIRLSPILDMLSVRYVIFRGSPPATVHPPFQSFDYWALVNSNALPRAFIPRHLETIADDHARLAKLTSPQFDPREVAFVETSVDLPGPARGSAEIVAEIPTRVTVSVQMETKGLLVLADLWDPGWRAYQNGHAVPILRTDHALRGVIVPAGTSTIDFRYEPQSFRLGLLFSGLSAVVMLIWLGTIVRQRADA